MRTISISKFKAQCLAILEDVRRTRRPLLVTRFGRPVAEVVPPSPPKRRKDRLGCMEGTARIVGDIVGPTTTPDDWDALRL